MVSGLVIVPNGTAPAGGWPVVTWAHPTTGMTGNCAPSLDPPTDVPLVNHLLDEGWEVVASDYLNENAYDTSSKALLPYGVAAEAARNVIDIVRAARNLPVAQASTNYLVWGFSEGATTAMSASNIAATYAPELTLKGTVAEATGTVSPAIVQVGLRTTDWPLLFMDVGGFNSAYGNTAAPLAQMLTPTGIKLITTVLKTEHECLNSIMGIAARYTSSQVFLPSVVRAGAALPAAWAKLIEENNPATYTIASTAPVLLLHGTIDTTVPQALSSQLADDLCTLKPPEQLERWLYTGLGHNTLLGYATGPRNANGNSDAIFGSSNTIDDIVQWMSDRFTGGPWPDPYVPTGSGIPARPIPVTQTNTCG